MQTRLVPQTRVTHLHPFLMAVLVQQPGRIQVQRITAGPGAKPLQSPAPERTKGRQILSRRSETLEEPAESRLAGDAGNSQERSQQYITAQVGHVRQLLGSGQNARYKPQAILEGLIATAALLETGKHLGQQIAEPMPMQKAGEAQQPGPTRDSLIREADLDGFVGSLEFNEL